MDALPALTTDKAKTLFATFGVLSERELAARVEINWERYVKVSNIEANCALDIAADDDPAGHGRAISAQLSRGAVVARPQQRVRDRCPASPTRSSTPSTRSRRPSTTPTRLARSTPRPRAFVDQVIPAQQALREVADELEALVADDLWPLPKYRELLFQY